MLFWVSFLFSKSWHLIYSYCIPSLTLFLPLSEQHFARILFLLKIVPHTLDSAYCHEDYFLLKSQCIHERESHKKFFWHWNGNGLLISPIPISNHALKGEKWCIEKSVTLYPYFALIYKGNPGLRLMSLISHQKL